MSAGTGAGRRYVRDAVRRGAIEARPGSAFHLRIADLLEVTNAFGLIGRHVTWCDHIVDRGELGDAVVTIQGPDAYQWRCVDCFTPPTRDLGCANCDRQPPPGLRLVVYADPPDVSGIAVVAHLCTYCRRGAI